MIRIATWNVQRPTLSQAKRRERLLQAIQSMRADVWILTETHSSIFPSAEFSSATTEEPDRPHESGESWVSIWSRFPIECVSETSDPSRSLAVRIVPEAGRSIVVYGTVLPWLGSNWRNHPSKGGAAFAAALKAQLSDWLSLQEANPLCNFVLGGDLNQDLSTRHYYGSGQNKAALRAALETAQLRCFTAAEHDPVPKHAPIRASIDHICVGAGLSLVGDPVSWPVADRPVKTISDHFGVAVDLAEI